MCPIVNWMPDPTTRATCSVFRGRTATGVGEGSAGFNAWREVATHEMVSDWIVEDGHGGGRSATAVVLRDWIDSRWDCGAMDVAVSAKGVVDQLLGVTQRMRACGLVHFDVHLDNILTTGQNLIVSDFGLAAAAHFQLDDAERRFLATHVDHDVAYCAAELANAILGKTMAFPHARARNAWLRDLPRADTLGEGGGTTVRHRPTTRAHGRTDQRPLLAPARRPP